MQFRVTFESVQGVFDSTGATEAGNVKQRM